MVNSMVDDSFQTVIRALQRFSAVIAALVM